jgi:peptidase C39-like protein
MRRVACVLIALLLATAAVTAAEAPARAALKSVRIKDVPHVQQKPDFCGEACVEMACRKLGKEISQDTVFNASGLDPVLGRGCHTSDLQRALGRLGFKVGTVSTAVDADKATGQLAARWRQVHADLARNVPTIICMRTGDGPKATEHFRLVVGYDAESDEVVYHEPDQAGGAYRRMKRSTLLGLWPLKYKPKRWTVIALRLEPGAITVPKKTEGFTRADYAQHILALKKRVPKGFTVIVQKPFVVIGDEPAAVVRRRAEQTVKWAVLRLKKEYFTKDPDAILDIWLFKDKASYRKHTKEIFNDNPGTPFGYYSSSHKALIMNIATGGGTLVHEIVHPFVASNFPECPSWFNEGLGSLYEQSSSRGGRIVGLTNWRLAGLQKAIKAGTVPSFKTLTSTTTRQFYNEDKGTNYGQVRYLCYYLQEKGLLKKYYHAFYKARKIDPTGYATLKTVLGIEDMDAFKTKWEKYVLKLRFP